jgi:hypothetical protein
VGSVFKVLPAEPLSDHQPLECMLHLHQESGVGNPPSCSDEAPQSVPKWDPNKRAEYVYLRRSHPFQEDMVQDLKSEVDGPEVVI